MGAYKRKLKRRGVRWFYSGQYLGIKYHSECIYKTQREALNAERLKLDEIDEQKRNPVNDLFLVDLVNERLDYIELKQSWDYYRENKRYFKKILKAWGNNIKVSEITREMVNKFLMKEARRLQRSGKGFYKVNSCLRSLRALFNYSRKIYNTSFNPCDGLDFYPINISLKYIPPDDHVEAVKAKCNPNQRLLVDFVDETACRIMEAVRFKYEDIDGDLITLWTHKSRNSNFTPRRIPKPDCLNSLKGRGAVFNFTVLPRFLRNYVEELNQPIWSWHNLRHRRASIWANSGMTTFEIMSRLGHSNLSTTMRYLQLLGFTRL